MKFLSSLDKVGIHKTRCKFCLLAQILSSNKKTIFRWHEIFLPRRPHTVVCYCLAVPMLFRPWFENTSKRFYFLWTFFIRYQQLMTHPHYWLRLWKVTAQERCQITPWFCPWREGRVNTQICFWPKNSYSQALL